MKLTWRRKDLKFLQLSSFETIKRFYIRPFQRRVQPRFYVLHPARKKTTIRIRSNEPENSEILPTIYSLA